MYNLFVYLGLRQFTEKPIRSAMIVIGVAFGISLFVAITLINKATMSAFKDSIEAVSGKAALTVSAGETGFPESTLALVQTEPGVRVAVPLVEARGTLTTGTHSETMMVMGVDMLKEQSIRSYQSEDGQVMDDPLLFLNQPDSIIITKSFAQAHALKADSKFNLMTAHGLKPFTVRGLLTPTGAALAYGGAIAIMDIDGARMSFGKENKLDRIDIITREGQDAKELAARLRTKLGAGYTVEDAAGQLDIMAKMVNAYRYLLALFSFLALIASLFLIANGISIAISERRKEIGTLRALGTTRGGILRLYLSESFIIGLLGSFLGAFMGWWLAGVLLNQVRGALEAQYQIRIDITHLDFGASDLLSAVAIGSIAAVVAALWPSIQAMRLSPLEAIRSGAGETGEKRGFTRFLPLTGFIMLAILVISSVLRLSSQVPAIEIMNQTFAMVGAAFVAPLIVAGLIRLFQPLSAKVGGIIPFLSAGNLLRNPARTGGHVMTLMIGLIYVVNIASINVSFKKTIVGWFAVVLRADLVVSSGSLLANQVQPIHEDLKNELQKIPGIGIGTEPGVYASRTVNFNYGEEQTAETASKSEPKKLSLMAFDEPAVSHHYDIFDMSERDNDSAGRDLFHSSTPTVFVSQNFVLNFNKNTGDTISMPSPVGPIPMKIVGVIVDWASPVGSVTMSREQYKKYWRDPLVNSFNVYLQPGTDASKVRQDIDSQLGEKYRLNVVLAEEFRRQTAQTIDQSFSYTQTIQITALLIGLLGLLNALMVSVMERTREIGMLRAVGMTSSQVRAMILWEAIYLGAFGALGAVLLGSLISYLWITYSLTSVLGWVVTYNVPTYALITAVASGIFVAIIAGAYPAYRATKVEIREALNYE